PAIFVDAERIPVPALCRKSPHAISVSRAPLQVAGGRTRRWSPRSGGLLGRGAACPPRRQGGGAPRPGGPYPPAAERNQLDSRVGEDGGQPAGVLDREELVVGGPGQQRGLGEAGQLGGDLVHEIVIAQRRGEPPQVAPHPLVGEVRGDPLVDQVM